MSILATCLLSTAAISASAVPAGVQGTEVSFTEAVSNVTESATVVSIEVTLSGPVSAAVSIPYVAGGSADAGDRTVDPGPLVIPAGQTTGTIDVTVLDDAESEGRERVTLILGSPTGATLGSTNVHELIIADDEPAATIEFDITSQSRSEGSGTHSATLTLSEPRTEEARISFTQTGTATPSGVDVTVTPASPVVIPGGQTTASIDLSIVPDAIDENDETLVLTLLLPYNSVLGNRTQHTLTIEDDDDPPTVSFATQNSTIVETDSSLSVVVELSGPSAFDVTLPVTSSGSATLGTDYSFAPSSLLIPAGATSTSIDFSPIDDTAVEGTETATLQLGSPTSATLGGTPSHDVLIIDDEASPPTLSFSQASSTAEEPDGTIDFPFELTDYAAQPITFAIGTAGTATPGVDYDLDTPSVTIPVGSLSASATVTLIDDSDPEAPETVVLSIGSPGSVAVVGAPSNHTLTIEDDDEEPFIDFQLASSSGGEHAGIVSVEVVLSGPSSQDVTLPVLLSGTASLGGVDATVTPNPLVIPMGSTTGRFDVAIENDDLHEDDEVILFTMGTPTGAELGTLTTHSFEILDDDPPSVVQFGSFRNVIDESIGVYGLRVALDRTSGVDVAVAIATSGQAVAPSDFTMPPGPHVVPAGQDFIDVPVTIVDDGVPELPERLLFTMSSPVRATLGATTSHLILINGSTAGPLQPLAPPLAPSVSELQFPQLRVGEVSAPRTIVVTNLHSSPVTLTGETMIGPHAGDFQVRFPGGLPAVLAPSQSAAIEVRFAPLTRGVRTARVRSEQENPAGQTGRSATAPFVELSGTSIGLPGQEIQMTASEEGFVSPSRSYWSPEYGATGGALVSYWNGVAGTTLDALYLTQRVGATFRYELPLPSGRYEVTLRSIEPEMTGPGQRVFDVILEGAIAINDLDIWSEVGFEAAWDSMPLTVDVVDGVLDMELRGAVGEANLSAFEVRSVADISTQTTALAFGTVDQGASATLSIPFENAGLQAATIDEVTFRLGGSGDSRDFTVTDGSVVYAGSTGTVTRSSAITLAPGTTAVDVEFTPTFHDDHDFTIQFSSTQTGDLFVIAVTGTGGAEAGWGFLHPVPDTNPPFIVDYDMSGTESVQLLGAESHTHEPGHALVGYEWRVGGSVVANTVDHVHAFSVGTETVSLTIEDDNTPPNTATDTMDVTVHPVDRVPGALLQIYAAGSTTPQSLLDNVPASADHVARASGLSVDVQGSTIGTSPFTGDALVRISAMFELANTRTLEFVPIGGDGDRVYVNGVLTNGPVTLGAGVHDVEARFAVVDLGDLPVAIHVMENGVRAVDLESSVAHDEGALPPVIHTMPSIGSDLGGNRVDIDGFGFFPEAQTVVHWGSQAFTSSQFDEWSGEKITLTTPPGSGTISVTVETPQGTSEPVPYTYSPTGPVPIRFDLLTSQQLTIDDVTTGAFGPDGKLYAASLDGYLHVVEYDENYSVVSHEVHDGVSNLTNHDCVGIAFNPFDEFDPQDPSSIKVWMAHGEQFQNGGGAFTGPSYFTGQISTVSGPDFDAPVPVITQLPVSNHDHSVNGLVFDENGDLMICVGGNTNAGVREPLLGDLPESPLSAAVLRAKISDPSFDGMILYRDSNSGVFVDDQVFGEQIDVVPGVDVEVYATGFRNPLDLCLHSNGYLFATDNGPNPGYGVGSTGLTTDDGNAAIYFQDELNLIEYGNYYGSANRARGRYDLRQAIFRSRPTPSIPGEYRRAIMDVESSTNGLVEYRATAFNSRMRGDLLAMKWGFGMYRIELTADGRRVQTSTLHTNPNNTAFPPNRGLNVVTGPGGAIIALDYTGDAVRVQVPDDFAAIGPTPYEITPWRVPASGGQPFVIGGSSFGTSTGQVTVTIGGVQATVTSVSEKRIHGVYPASPSGGATDDLDIVVTVGADVRTIEGGMRYLPSAPGQATGHWRDGSVLPLALGEVAAGVIDGVIYIFGQGDARTFARNVLQRSWSYNNLAQRPFPGNHHGLEVTGGKVYLIGGLDGGSAGKVQIYDPQTNTWTVGAPMPWNGGSVVTGLIDGRIYVGGGVLQGAGTAGNFAVYDPALDAWTSLGAMPTAVNHAAAGTDGERLFVFGGRQGQNVPQPGFDDVQIYDPVMDTWETSDAGDVPAMPLARGGTGRAVYSRGNFYIMGGEDATNAFADVQVYDPVDETWSLERPMPTARHGIYPVEFEGRVFVFGGGLNAGFGTSAVSETFSPR